MENINIETLTIAQARGLVPTAQAILQLFGDRKAPPEPPTHPLVGEPVLLRTVTHYYTGRLVEANAAQYVLADAAWIPSTGRLSTALATGTLDEVEPYPAATLVYIERTANVDLCSWGHALPREVK